VDATDAVITPVAVGRQPIRNAIYRERDAIYVANALDNSISAIRIADDTVAATMPVGTSPGIGVELDGIELAGQLFISATGTRARSISHSPIPSIG
jgi:YVTN family beta-propeller protein